LEKDAKKSAKDQIVGDLKKSIDKFRRNDWRQSENPKITWIFGVAFLFFSLDSPGDQTTKYQMSTREPAASIATFFGSVLNFGKRYL
jgi:hypothetical protein